MPFVRHPVATKQWQRAVLAATVSPEPLPWIFKNQLFKIICTIYYLI